MLRSLLGGSSTIDAVENARIFSEERVGCLRQTIEPLIPNGYTLVTYGSYARREAGPDSDLDYIIIGPEGANNISDIVFDTAALKQAIESAGCKPPSAGGAFSEFETYGAFCQNLGGDGDTNKNITRRILFLLEGDYVVNKISFTRLRKNIIERYIQNGIGDHQIALFLLNDVIRYYRTIAVDFEFKTGEEKNPKPWGIRNIKLVFARKLMYASGLFSIAMTADQNKDRKIGILEALFNITPIARMEQICGAANVSNLLGSYSIFLKAISDETTRNHLKSLEHRSHSDEIFRELKNESYFFTRELLKLFDSTFDRTHPIKRAVLF